MKILLACDPMSPGEELIEQVQARLWPEDAEFRVLTVVERLPPDFYIEVPDLLAHAEGEAAKHAQALGRNFAARLRDGGLKAESFIHEGDPHDVIVEQADKWQANVILLGAPRRENGFPALNSRIARAVIRHAHCSVQIMRTGAVRRVLVPTDGSKYSLAAAHAVARDKWAPGTEFEVMSVVEPLTRAVRYLYPPYGILSESSEEAETLRAQEMQHVVDAIRITEKILVDAGLTITDHVLINVDAPGKLILEEAETWHADLVVMGSHGRRGIRRLLIGSVSESVAIHAACSVELVRTAAAEDE